jgi:hypothetical protein
VRSFSGCLHSSQLMEHCLKFLSTPLRPFSKVFSFGLHPLVAADIADPSVCVLKKQEKEGILGENKKSVYDVLGDYWM